MSLAGHIKIHGPRPPRPPKVMANLKSCKSKTKNKILTTTVKKSNFFTLQENRLWFL